MNDNIIKRAGEIISAISNNVTNDNERGFCALSLIDENGYPSVSTISISKCDGIKWLTFCTGYGTKDVKLSRCNKAGVCINSFDYNISLLGRLEVVTDSAVKKEMWYAGMGDHFKDWQDPGFCVLKFTTESYNLLVDWNAARGTL